MNSFYSVFFESLQKGNLNLIGDSLKIALLKSDYAFSAAETTCSTLASSVIGTSAAMAGTTVSGSTATFPATDVSGVAADTNVAGLVVFKDTGDMATSIPLIYVSTGTGLPLTANGQKITVNFGSPSINLNAS